MYPSRASATSDDGLFLLGRQVPAGGNSVWEDSILVGDGIWLIRKGIQSLGIVPARCVPEPGHVLPETQRIRQGGGVLRQGRVSAHAWEWGCGVGLHILHLPFSLHTWSSFASSARVRRVVHLALFISGVDYLFLSMNWEIQKDFDYRLF